MKYLILICLLVQTLHAQKHIEKHILNPQTQLISIDATNCFKINLHTTNATELVVIADIEGEYTNDLIIHIKEDGQTSLIGAGFSPNFSNPNDKLSAHKVVSIALDIAVPKNKNVQISGRSCNVIATGKYKQLNVTLNEGDCSLQEVTHKADIKTLSGTINVKSSAAKIDAISKYGTISTNNIPTGTTIYNLNTVTGNINLNRNL